jgi:hypothetical protein
MSCFLTSGQSLGCSDSVGGLKKVYIVGGNADATIDALAYNADGAITGSTISVSGTTLYGFELKRNTSSFVQNVQKSFENATSFFEQVLTMVMYKYSQDKRNQLKILIQNDKLQIIAIDANDTQYLLGQENGLYLSGGSAGTGVALGDRNGFELTFTGQEKEPARVIVGSLATVFAGATING